MNIIHAKPKIIAVRIDDRLLHGIIVTQWLPQIKCNRVVIIDDAIANDELKKEVMRLSKPVNKALSIINKASFIENINSGRYGKQRLYIISKDISILPLLSELQYDLPKINFGMYFAKNSCYSLTNRIVISNSDLILLKKMVNLGLIFEAQYVPSEYATNLNIVILDINKGGNNG